MALDMQNKEKLGSSEGNDQHGLDKDVQRTELLRRSHD
jgi:hypothetical protein